MLKNYLKIAFRNLWRNKAYSLINIVGFALGMACVILIMLWVKDELSFDEFNTNKDNLYKVVCDWSRWEWVGFDGTPGPLGEKALEEIPEIENMFRVASVNREVFKYDDKTFYENGGVIIDPSIFEILSLPIIQGNIQTAFNGPDNMVISESLAKKYFGETSPLGKTVLVDGKMKTVNAVFKDIPHNSQIKFDYMYSFKYLAENSNWGKGWSAFNFVTYIQVYNDADLNSIGEKLVEIGKKYKSQQVVLGVTFRFEPYSEVYLHEKGFTRSFERVGDSTYVYIFSIVAFFVLLIACINFMNLSTAQSMNRSLEVGLRKTIGAKKSQLMKQFLVESVLMAFMAHIIAMIMVEMFLPTFNRIADKNISTDYLDVSFLITITCAVLITGLLAGLYPAAYLSNFKPIQVLRKSLTIGPKSISFRKVLVVFQFTLSITLIISTAILSKQLQYVSNKKLGFDKENVLYIPMEENIPAKYEIVKSELLKDPSILDVTAQRYNFINISYRGAGFKWEDMNPNRERSLDLIYSGVDCNYFESLNLPIVEGRAFSCENSSDRENSIVLNEAAIKEMNLDSPVGKWFDFGDDKHVTIIGIAKDVHIRTLRQEIEPRVFYITDFEDAGEGIILIKIIGGKISEAMAHIQNVWENVNEITPFEFNFLDEAYNNLYKTEIRTNKIFNYFTLLAIIISTLGLFGLASFSAERRTKEVGVRKVMGASTNQILYLLIKDFSKWVLIANIIAWPAAYFLGVKLLENYAYKTEITIDLFIISGLLAFLIAVFTISYKSFKAAVSNPINALRYE